MRCTRLLSMVFMFGALGGGCAGEIDPDRRSDGPQLAVAQLRRLTHAEFDRTIVDLLGMVPPQSAQFPTEAQGTTFSSSAETQVVTAPLAEAYLLTAENLATLALPGLLATYPCDGVDQSACARRFIEGFGQRAFRRPVAPDRVEAFMALFESVHAQHGYDRGIESIVEAMLQSPLFLYRVELSEPRADETWIPLDGWELASRLSYQFWGTMPDDELFALAASGELTDPDVLAAQAARLLDDPRARPAITTFFEEWLQLPQILESSKSRSSGLVWGARVKSDMLEEHRHFVQWVLWESDARFQTLMTSPTTFVNERIAPIYGVEPTTSGSIWEQRELDPTQRAGILTQLAVMSVHSLPDQSDPIRRGMLVRSRLLCQSLPLPDEVVPLPPEVTPDATTRQRFEQHMADPACAGCHALIDPIGFGFESLDLVGRLRALDGTEPIDDRGMLTGTLDIDGPFTGPVELAHRLADSAEAHRCFTARWFEHAFGRLPSPEDAPSLLALEQEFNASGQDIRNLLVATVRTEAFRNRRGK